MSISLKETKSRVTAIIEKILETQIIELANKEKRTKSSMVSILIEEAIKYRGKGENLDD